MTELKCIYECGRNAKFNCATCDEVLLCPIHVKQHKEDLGKDHAIEPIRGSGKPRVAPRPPSPQQLPEQKSQRLEPRVASFEPDGEEDTDVADDASEAPMQIPASKTEEEPRPTPKLTGGMTLTYKLFVSTTDVAQNFVLHKWEICFSEASTFLRRMAGASEVKVVGVYGGLRESLDFVSQVLQKEVDCEQESGFQGILGFANPETSTVCLVFRIKDESVYLTKPYPEKSRESVLVRLLLDLCPVIVCCPSDEMLRSWYWNEEPSQMNPFVPRALGGLNISMVREKLKSTELIEMRVVSELDRNSFSMTPDGLSSLFQWSTNRTDRKDLPPSVLTAIVQIINSTQDSLRTRKWTAIRQPPRFQDPPYNILKKLTNLPNLMGMERKVTAAYSHMLDTLEGYSRAFGGELWSEVERTFRMKSSISTSWGLGSLSIEKVRAELLEDVNDGWSQDREEHHLKKLTPFVESAKAGMKFPVFFKNKGRALLTEKDTWIRQVTRTFKEDIKAIILEEYRAVAFEEFIFTTCDLVVTDTTIILRATPVKNRIQVASTVSNPSFYMMDKEIAFTVFTVGGQLQVWKFSPSTGNRPDIEEITEVHSQVLIATGSHPKQFAAFYNDEQRAVYGALQDLKRIDKGASLRVYGDEVRRVISACILSNNTRKIFMINERGLLYVIELMSSNKVMQLVYAPMQGESKIPLRPKHGTRFFDIKGSEDETLYFLLCEQAIEVYDIGYELKRFISVNSSSVTFKVLAYDDFHIVMIQDRAQFKAYKFQSDSVNIRTTYQKKNMATVEGNPVVDILHYALLKFGSARSETAPGPALYVSLPSAAQQVDKYMHNLQMVCQQLQWRGSLLASRMGEFVRQVEVSSDFNVPLEVFRWKMLTRTPIHLASIQDGNLVPLQDGRNNFEEFVNQLTGHADFSSTLVNYIRFGCLEELIRKERDIKVVSILGRQSSGKSYLLNCLFGTRFDVAATRCTDGIWMSLAKVEGQTFVVLDCEGLFSAERNIQEEVKMCLILAAISDVTILNADLSFSRHITYLFEKFVSGLDRLKGAELFKGILELTIRDVPSNQDTGASDEIRSFIDKHTRGNSSDFFFKLFRGQIQAVLYHNFENRDLFERKVRDRCHLYRSPQIPVRWTSGEKFLIELKTALSCIYSDDSSFTDVRVFELTIQRILGEIRNALRDPSSLPELYRSQKPVLSAAFRLGGKSYQVSELMVGIRLNMVTTNAVFDKILEKVVSPTCGGPQSFEQFRRNNWKEWYSAVDDLTRKFFELLKQCVLVHFEQSLGRIDAELAPKVELEKMNLAKLIEDSLIAAHSLCLRNCSDCELNCLHNSRHSGTCTCKTDHKCIEMCSKCPSREKCTRRAGHKDLHVCSQNHLCGKPCSVPSCRDTCIGTVDHPESVHNCGKAFHPCMEKCLAYDYCRRTCAIDHTKPHDRHHCGQPYCPEPCSIPGCTATCASDDHLHNFPKTALHFCKNQHMCEGVCEADGVCNVKITSSERIWDNGKNTFQYRYTEVSAEKKRCVVPIGVGQRSHSGPHKCSITVHRCSVTCPDCGQYCEGEIKHLGYHYSGTHRNKEKCIYIAKTADFQYEYLDDSSTSTTRMLRAGEEAKPEICESSCISKGRGHTHPMLCKGSRECLELTHSGLAVHSKDKYYPDLSAVYDLVQCETYWKLRDWMPPVKLTSALEIFRMCPFYCGSPEHNPEEKHYCSGALFHTKSEQFRDHQFDECIHSPSAYDICFILDCTGSMSASFSQVKQVITNVIQTYNTASRSSMFAVIGYTDHGADKGAFDPNYPVSFYPNTKRLSDFSESNCYGFLTSLRADGGGSNTGEALVDGIHAGNELVWRSGSYRMCFIIADEGGHGYELAGPSANPPACPCGLDWRNELLTLKSSIQKCSLVKIGSRVEYTATAFGSAYGDGFEVISLTEMTKIQDTVTESIARVVTGHMEFSRS